VTWRGNTLSAGKTSLRPPTSAAFSGGIIGASLAAAFCHAPAASASEGSAMSRSIPRACGVILLASVLIAKSWQMADKTEEVSTHA
jgi:hypothetical protein